MGIYYNAKKKSKKDKLGIVMVSVAAVLLILAVLPFTTPVRVVLHGFLGLTIYPILVLISLIGVALIMKRTFSMSAKNLVYLILSSVLLLCALHTAFIGKHINREGAEFAHYFEFVCKTADGSFGVTVGGLIFSILVYPFTCLLGVVGTTIIFAILTTVFVGLTVDYYINIKSFYTKAYNRRLHYEADKEEYYRSSDTIGGSLTNLNSASDVVPLKEEYESYLGTPDSLDPTENEEEADGNIIYSDEPYPFASEESDESNEQSDYLAMFNRDALKNRDEENLSSDDKATSRYDPTKFSSPEEYIKYPYVPSIFNNSNNDTEESQEDTWGQPQDEDSDSQTTGYSFGENSGLSSERTERNERNSNTPFVFNSLDNDFPDVRSRRGEQRSDRMNQDSDFAREDFSGSPFVGYTPSEFNARRERSPESTDFQSRSNDNRPNMWGEREDSRRGGIELTPKQTPEQIVMPGVRNKPKQYKHESDKKYHAPLTSLLERREDDPSKYGNDYEEKSRALESILSSFKIDAKVVGVTRGPSVTQYELSMPFGISVKRILQYDGDITGAVRSKKGIRIEAPIAGKNTVGVEVPNDQPSTVGLRELLEAPEFANSKAVLPFVIGKNIYGETIIKSLPKMVHMLVAGSTGSGKSVFLHSIIVSLMYKCSPSQLRFIMIDPKRVEFNVYSGMPHMMLPNAVSNCDKAINALGWAVKEMERRFDSFQTLSMQNIEDYNHCDAVKSGEYPKIPYIVIIIDELNELMMTGKKDVEEKITRLSQLGRASGIHIIIATQRPSTDVVTGTIKNNLPTRVAFALQSGIDSRVILDEVGAETLLGRGDMLMAPYDDNVTSRVQGAWISMDEVRKVVAYIKDNNESYFDEEVAREILADKTPPESANDNSSIAGNLEPDLDELLPAALKLCIDTGGASINMIQRRFRVGYARAARIIDQMELAGYVSPGNGSKLRQVHISIDEYNAKFGEDK